MPAPITQSPFTPPALLPLTPSAPAAATAEGPAFALDVTLTVEPSLGGSHVAYHIELSTAADGEAERAAALRRLIVRRAPRDLARLGVYVARIYAEVRRRPTYVAALVRTGDGEA